jgi:uncharacterized protein
MQYRTLGRTGIKVGIIGMGCEYLINFPQDHVAGVIGRAIDKGVNYLDLFFGHPEIRDHYGAALAGRRQTVTVAGHLGASFENGQYARTRDPVVCDRYFLDLLKRLRTDYIDIVMLHNCDEEDDYRVVMDTHLPLALKYKQEGKARHIGFSSHRVSTALKAVKTGIVDVLLFQINMGEHGAEGRDELLRECVRRQVGVVAMKAYGGGKLLTQGNVSGLTPVNCLTYALSQVGVSTVVPGVKNTAELDAALHYLDATAQEKDFSAVLPRLAPNLRGGCVYCNHCLPCQAGLDIGHISRLVDACRSDLTELMRNEYASLEHKASECIDCGLCRERCPWNVDAPSAMRQAVDIFGT